MQIAHTAAVHFHLHTKRLGQVSDLEQWRNATHVAYAAARKIAGAILNPFGAYMHLAFGGLGSTNRKAGIFAEPNVRGHTVLVHRFFHPRIIELLEPLGQLQCLFAGVIVERIEHQRHVGTHSFAHGGAGGNIAFGIGRARDGWLPGV